MRRLPKQRLRAGAVFGRLETDLKQNRFWSDQLEHLAANNLEFSEIIRHDERINAVTRESVRDAARKYLHRNRDVIGILNPEVKP